VLTVSLTSDPEGEEADCWARATTLQIRSPVVGKNTLMAEIAAKIERRFRKVVGFVIPIYLAATG
jgi:hypothetical protein